MPLTKVADIPQQMLDIYSRKLLMDAMPALHFRQFVDYKLEFGVQPGERIKFTRLDNLPEGGQLPDEDTPIQKNKMSGSDQYISVVEFGNAASFSRKASVVSLRNMLDDAKRVLGRDYVLVMDKYLRDIFLTVANKWYAKADGTTGAAVGDVAGQMTKDTLQGVIEAAKNLNIPKLRRGGDEFFAMVCSANTIRQIRADDYWLDARKYVDPSDMLTGEAGRLDDVVFLDTTHMHDLQQTGVGAGGADVNRSVLIGADCVGYGESVPMELIPEAPEDFGRKQAIAWYTIAGAGILNDYGFDIYTKAGVPA